MTDPLTTLETDLNTLATVSGGTASATGDLQAAQAILALLVTATGSPIGPAVAGFYSAIATALNDVVEALQAISQKLSSLTADGNPVSGSDAASALSALQNALQTAASLVPGASSATASALSATTQFTTLFTNLLTTAGGDLTQAATTLNDIALQLGAIATAFTNAAAGTA